MSLDSTKKFRIISHLHQFMASYQQGSTFFNHETTVPLNSNNNNAASGSALRSKTGDDDFSIDNENEATNTKATTNFESSPGDIQPAAFIIDNDLTLVIEGTIRKVQDQLFQTVERWLGPVSIAVFAQTTLELNRTLYFVHQAVQCNQLTKEFVSFHLVFPVTLEEKFQTILYDRSSSSFVDHSSSTAGAVNQPKTNGRKPKKKKQRGKNGNSKKLNTMCQKFYHKLSNPETEFDQFNQGHKAAMEDPAPAASVVEYPVNLLRNVARKYTQTKYSLVCDIEVLPSEQLRVRFQNFIKSSRVDNSKTSVFVVPAFEVMNRRVLDVPMNKEQLVTLLDKYEARPYSFDICWKCQANTDYETWQRESSSNPNELSILVETLWHDPWEPFFISDNSVPLYDEHFSLSSLQPLLQPQASDYARLSQICELHISGYKFAILKDMFLIHNGFRDLSDISTSFSQSQPQFTSSSLGAGGAAAGESSSTFSNSFDTIQSNYERMKLGLKDKYPQSTRTCD